MADDHADCRAEIARLTEHVARLGREHARHSLAVSAHKGRGDQMESRAIRAEKQLARFLGYTEQYDKLAESAATSRRNADLVRELRRRIEVLERSDRRAAAEAVAAERERIARELDDFAQMARDTAAGYPRDPGPTTTGEARLEMEGRAGAYVKAAEIARGVTGGEGWGEP